MPSRFVDELNDRLGDLSPAEKRALVEGRRGAVERDRARRAAAAGMEPSPAPHQPEPVLREVLFEFMPKGDYVRVAAVDPDTGTEVTIVGAATATQAQLEAIATRKLLMVLRRRGG